jgi:hypothetical protein
MEAKQRHVLKSAGFRAKSHDPRLPRNMPQALAASKLRGPTRIDRGLSATLSPDSSQPAGPLLNSFCFGMRTDAPSWKLCGTLG